VAAGDVRVWAADDAKSPSRVIPRERGVLGRSPVRVAALMDADKTRAWISAERFAPFLERAAGDPALAFDLYLWHARISGASLTTLHHFEVALRNAIDRQLGTGQPQTGIEQSWLLDPETLSAYGIAKVRDVLARLEREGYPREHPRIIAGLPFSF
jgi:hypothetical protein